MFPWQAQWAHLASIWFGYPKSQLPRLLGRWELPDMFVGTNNAIFFVVISSQNHASAIIVIDTHHLVSLIYYYVVSSYTIWPYIIIYHHHISPNLYQIIIFSFNMLLSFSHQLRSNEDPPVPGAEDLPTEITPSRWGPISNGKPRRPDRIYTLWYIMTFLYFAILVSCVLCRVCVCFFFCGAIVKDDPMTTATVSWGAECWQKLRICSGVPVRGIVCQPSWLGRKVFRRKGFHPVPPRSRFLRSWKWLAANGFSSRGRGIFTSPLSILGLQSSQVILFLGEICWKRYPFLKVGLKFFFWSWIIWIFIRYFIHIHGCFRK